MSICVNICTVPTYGTAYVPTACVLSFSRRGTRTDEVNTLGMLENTSTLRSVSAPESCLFVVPAEVQGEMERAGLPDPPEGEPLEIIQQHS